MSGRPLPLKQSAGSASIETTVLAQYLDSEGDSGMFLFHWRKVKQRSSWHVDSSWNVMEYGDAHEGKWRGNWWMEWVASTLHTTSEHGVSSITTADAHTSTASSRLNWRPRQFKWTRPFCRKTKSRFCACAITFQTQSTIGSALKAEVTHNMVGISAISYTWFGRDLCNKFFLYLKLVTGQLVTIKAPLEGNFFAPNSGRFQDGK